MKTRQTLGNQQLHVSFQFPWLSLNNPKIRPLAHTLAHTSGPVDNLKTNGKSLTVKSRQRISFRTICELLDLKSNFAAAEPHFEVAPSPFERGAYIARMSRNGIAVFEPLPHEFMSDDADHDLTMFWPVIRKRLVKRLALIESLIP